MVTVDVGCGPGAAEHRIRADRGGQPVAHRPWQDTVLMQPEERVEIAFKADNPGDWLFHCHVLEHMAVA